MSKPKRQWVAKTNKSQKWADMAVKPQRPKVLCMYWLKKGCRDGKNCKFAHGTVKIHKHNRLCHEWLQNGKCQTQGCSFAHGVEKLTEQTKVFMCRNMTLNGSCPYGEKCIYAHAPRQQVRQAHCDLCPFWLVWGRCNRPDCQDYHGTDYINRRGLCIHWLQFGECKKTDCVYAHSVQILHQI